MEGAAAVVGLSIPADYREGVAAQLVLNYRLVAPLLGFNLPERVGPAPDLVP